MVTRFEYPAVEAVVQSILVVDDTATERFLVEVLLSREGAMDVNTASNGLEALAICDAQGPPIDVVVTDLRMPEMDGVELARRLVQRRPAIPTVLLMSVPGSEELTVNALKSGATTFVRKDHIQTHLVPILQSLSSAKQSECHPLSRICEASLQVKFAASEAGIAACVSTVRRVVEGSAHWRHFESVQLTSCLTGFLMAAVCQAGQHPEAKLAAMELCLQELLANDECLATKDGSSVGTDPLSVRVDVFEDFARFEMPLEPADGERVMSLIDRPRDEVFRDLPRDLALAAVLAEVEWDGALLRGTKTRCGAPARDNRRLGTRE